MKSLFTAAAAIAMIAAVPTTAAVAQEAAAVSPGMELVHDKTGDPIGQIVRVQDGAVVFSTDKHSEVAMPANAFLAHEGKVLFAMTRAEINAAVDADLAKAEAMMQPGAPVLGSAGTQVGTIDAIDEELVTIALENGGKVQIPVSGTAPSPDGLIIGLTAEQLAAQVQTPAEGGASAEAGATADGGTL